MDSTSLETLGPAGLLVLMIVKEIAGVLRAKKSEPFKATEYEWQENLRVWRESEVSRTHEMGKTRTSLAEILEGNRKRDELLSRHTRILRASARKLDVDPSAFED